MSFLNNLTSSNSSAIGVGPNGSTNPVFQTDCSVSSAATGVKITGRAAAAGASIDAVSSGTNEDLAISSKGSGKINLNGGADGIVQAGVTANPAFTVDPTTPSSVTGVKVKSAAAAGGVAISVTSSGTDENLTIDAKGAGTITIGGTSTGNTVFGQGATSKHATKGIGYSTGAGGAVTQATGRTTGVTLNKAAGAITLVSAAGSATPFTFTVTNSAVAATDVILVSQKSGTDKYRVDVTNVQAGQFDLTIVDLSGTTTEQPVFNFAVIKAVAA